MAKVILGCNDFNVTEFGIEVIGPLTVLNKDIKFAYDLKEYWSSTSLRALQMTIRSIIITTYCPFLELSDDELLLLKLSITNGVLVNYEKNYYFIDYMEKGIH